MSDPSLDLLPATRAAIASTPAAVLPPMTLAEAARDALHPAGAPRLPIRSREQTSAAEVARIARTLFRHFDPLAGASGMAGRQLRHFYSPTLLRGRAGGPPVDYQLGATYEQGGRLFLRGESLGVGASTLAADFARAFNTTARERRDPRRAAYLTLTADCATVPRFLDALALALRAPLTATELRLRAPEYIATRLRVACQHQGITTITIDHVSKAGPKVRELIGGLMCAFDPNYTVALDPHDPLDAPSRIGFVLVDHHPPEVLFRSQPEVLLLLDGQTAVLRRYRRPEEVAEALRQAGIGLDDFDLADPEDAETAALVLEQTRGLAVLMAPLLALIDQVARQHSQRPSPAFVHAVLPYVRRLRAHREATDAPAEPTGGGRRPSTGRAHSSSGDSEPSEAGTHTAEVGVAASSSRTPEGVAGRYSGRPARPAEAARRPQRVGSKRREEDREQTRSEALREKRNTQHLARAEQRDVQRKSYPTLR